jgi:hypothetical protein
VEDEEVGARKDSAAGPSGLEMEALTGSHDYQQERNMSTMTPAGEEWPLPTITPDEEWRPATGAFDEKSSPPGSVSEEVTSPPIQDHHHHRRESLRKKTSTKKSKHRKKRTTHSHHHHLTDDQGFADNAEADHAA